MRKEKRSSMFSDCITPDFLMSRSVTQRDRVSLRVNENEKATGFSISSTAYQAERCR